MHGEFPATVWHRLKGDRIVEVLRIEGIDRDDKLAPPVLPLFDFLRGNRLLDRLCLRDDFGREFQGQLVAVDDGQHIDARGIGWPQ